MQQHAQDVRHLIIKDIKSDSFASHFSKVISTRTTRSSSQTKFKVQDHLRYRFEILWKGNLISAVKTFGEKTCTLCSHERLAIFKALHGPDKKKTINT
jgi:hypothetical protein